MSAVKSTPILSAGERIHYCGDQANAAEDGYIRRVTPRAVEVVLDDDRTFTVPPQMFEEGPGRRFWLRWQREREYAQGMYAHYGRITCTVHVSERCYQPDGPTQGVDGERIECPSCYDVMSA